MTEAQSYLDASDEAVRAARRLLDAGLYAPAAYYAFHAFESAGNAFSASHGDRPGRNHRKSRKRFKKHYYRAGLQRQIEPVQRIVYSLRNIARYPRQRADGSWQGPGQQVEAETAENALRRVRGILPLIRQNL